MLLSETTLRFVNHAKQREPLKKHVKVNINQKLCTLKLYNHEKVYSTNYYGHSIFVFDWDGSLKKHFVLDKGILRMVVDENHRKIYGISDDPEYQIIVFSY